MKIGFSQPNVLSLFSVPYEYRVPVYQRPYAWGDRHIDDLWQDVQTSDASGHFLGPMVLFDSKEDGVREVIDGQQRLTTLQIIVALIRDKYWELDDRKASGPPDSLIWKGGYSPAFRFRSSRANRQFLETFVLLHPEAAERRSILNKQHLKQVPRAERERNRRLIDAWTRLRKHLEEYLVKSGGDQKAALRNLESKLVNGVYCVVLDLEDLNDAFLLFETLNYRGLALSAADLLKSHLLAQIDKQNDSEAVTKASAQWDEMIAVLGGGDVSAYLRHYLLMSRERVKKSDVFPFFKDEVKQAGPTKTVDDLVSMANLYAEFLRPATADDPTIQRVLWDLRGTGVDTHRIALLPARRYLSDKEFMTLARACEVLSFRWTVTGQNAQVLESLYQKAASSLRKSEGQQLKEVEGLLRESIPPDDRFEEAFVDQALGYQYVAAYAMRRLEEALAPGEKAILPPAQVHLEHIMPATPTTYWRKRIGDDEDYESVVQRWGNLTLLLDKLNQGISNGDWDVKVKKGYTSSTIKLTQGLLDHSSWTSGDINLRAHWLARLAVQVWSLSPNVGEVPLYEEVRKDPAILGLDSETG